MKMLNANTNREKTFERLCYAAGIICSILYCFWALNLWNYDFNVPLWYRDGDNLATPLFTKRLMDGFYFTDLLGAPFGSLQVDFPLFGDTLNYAVRAVLLLVTGANVGLTINLFYIGLFPLTYCVSFFVMRKMGANRWAAALASLLYMALPYRILRNTMHLDLSNYSFVPLCAYLCMLVWWEQKEYRRTKREWAKVALLLLPIALSGIYYAFFSCFFLTVALFVKFFKDRIVSRTAVFSLGGIIAYIALAMIPYVWLQFNFGKSPEAPVRSAIEAEVYGLKITQFFLPYQSHGIPFLENLMEMYSNAPVPNEGSEYLGIVGGIGLLVSLLTILGFQKSLPSLQILGKLNLCGILLATVGGFGSVFSLLISGQIRGYNRISVFIAFFALATIAILSTELAKKIKWRKIFIGGAALLYCVSLAEQTIFQGEQWKQTEQSYYSDENFVKEIEDYATPGAMIYQYPYFPFPEMPPQNNMGDYALSRGYLHSSTLKWSYGDYKGRGSDLWNRALSQKPLAEQLKTIAIVGFEGVYIDTYAYTQEQLDTFTDELEQEIGTTDVMFRSEDERLLFYGLHDYSATLQSEYTAEQLENLRMQYMLSMSFEDGFYDLESSEFGNWRWCSEDGTIRIINPLNKPVMVSMEMMAETGAEKESNLQIVCGGATENHRISSSGTKITLSFEMQPGDNEVHFSSDAKPIRNQGDRRTLCFRLIDLTITSDL